MKDGAREKEEPRGSDESDMEGRLERGWSAAEGHMQRSAQKTV